MLLCVTPCGQRESYVQGHYVSARVLEVSLAIKKIVKVGRYTFKDLEQKLYSLKSVLWMDR